MKKLLLLFCISCASSIFAEKLNFDLAGTWKMVITKSENKDCLGSSELSFVSSPFITPGGQKLFMAKGLICGRAIWGASIEEAEGQQHIVWYDQEKQIFDAESNIIISSMPRKLSLGGDFEEYEVAKMTKIN